MIHLHDSEGHSIYLAPDAICEITEAGASNQWHGIQAFVRTFDRRVLEVRQSAREVAMMVNESNGSYEKNMS